MRSSLGPVAGRVVAVIATVLLIGIGFKLVGALLQPVLPAGFSHDLAGGWALLYGIVSPAMAPIAAIGLLLAIVWIVTGLRR